MTENTYDLGIIGGGPAGYTAALHAKASITEPCPYASAFTTARSFVP